MFGTLAQTQMANLDRLKHLALPLDQRHFLLESNALIGTMMAHLDSTKAVIKILTHSRLDDMLRRTIATTRAYDAYCQSLAPWIDQIVESAAWTITLTIPTTTTASLVSTTCSVIEKYTQSSPQETPDVLRASPATNGLV